MRKAQVSIFIIIGVIALLLAISFLVYRSFFIPQAPQSKEDATQQVENFVNACLEKSGLNVLKLIGEQAGYYSVSGTQYITTDNGSVPYWQFQQENLAPSKAMIEEQISYGIRTELKTCINDFKTFHIKVQAGELSANSKIYPDNVEISVNYPLTFKYGEETLSQNQFATKIYVPLGNMIDDANTILMVQQNLGDYINMNLLFNLTSNATVWRQNDYIAIYQLTQKEAKPNEIPYFFSFGYKMSELNFTNNPPLILNAKNWTNINVGDIITYQFLASDPENDSVFFDISDPSLGKLNQTTGLFEFYASPETVGSNSFSITVTDINGNENFENMFIYVNRPGIDTSP